MAVSLYRRDGKGNYHLRIYDAELGIDRTQSTKTRNKQEAIRWKKRAEEMLLEARRDQFIGGTPEKKLEAPTLKEYVYGWQPPGETGYRLGWLHTIAERSLKHTTRLGYERILNKHLIPAFGKMPLDRITTAGIYDLIEKLFNGGLKSRTVRNVKNCLGAILRQAAKEEYIPSNPARQVEVSTPESETLHLPSPFTRAERDAFEVVFKKDHPRYYPLIVCGFRTGMRMGELIGLRWDRIDFDNRTIHVVDNIAWGQKTTPKNRTGRMVRMTTHLSGVLLEHRGDLEKEAREKIWQGIPEYVFPNHAGRFVNYGNFSHRVWHDAIETARIDGGKTPHDMRHSYATFRLSQGHPIAEVAKELGHSDPEITYRIYYQWIPDMSRSDIDELD